MGLIQIKDTTFISMILIPQLCFGCFAGFYTFAIFLCRVNMFLRLLFEWRYSYGFKNIWLTSIYCTEVLSSYLLLLVVPMIRIYPTLEDTYYVVMDVKSMQRVTKNYEWKNWPRNLINVMVLWLLPISHSHAYW